MRCLFGVNQSMTSFLSLYTTMICAIPIHTLWRRMLIDWLVEVFKKINYPLIFIMCACSYITPAHIKHRARVHLLGFRDSLTIILNLPAPHLRMLRSMLYKYKNTDRENSKRKFWFWIGGLRHWPTSLRRESFQASWEDWMPSSLCCHQVARLLQHPVVNDTSNVLTWTYINIIFARIWYFRLHLHWIMTICGGAAKYTCSPRPKARVRPE